MTDKITPRGYTAVTMRNNTYDGTPSVTSQHYSWNDFRRGTENPRYKQNIADGANATTPLQGNKRVISSWGNLWSEWSYPTTSAPQPENPVYRWSIIGSPFIPTQGSLVVPSGSDANNAALGQFYRNARAAQTSLTGLSFLGELAETIHMLRHPGEKLFESVNDYLRAIKKLPRRSPHFQKQLAGTYLEYAFGWVPLIYDMKGAASALNKLMSVPKVQRVSGFGITEASHTVSEGTGTVYTNIDVTNKVVDTSMISVRYRGGVRVTGSGPSLDHAMDLFGFRVDEFVPAVWEVLPWSWLVDYFSNVGDIISATFYASGNLAWANKTVRTETTRKCRGSYNLNWYAIKNDPRCFKGAGGTYGYVWSDTTVDRSTPTPGIPTLQLTLPGRTKQWCNMAAVAAQFAKSYF